MKHAIISVLACACLGSAFILLASSCGFERIEFTPTDAAVSDAACDPSDDASACSRNPAADGSNDGAAAPYVFVPSAKSPAFVDDFGRSDGALGNGWLVKTAGSFSLLSGRARQESNATNLPDWLVTRPQAEAALDVEVSATVTLGDGACCSWTFLLARVQSISDQPGNILAYRLAFNAASMNGELVKWDTGSGATSPVGSGHAFAISLVLGETCRVSLRLTGKEPVLLEGGMWKSDGSPLGSVRGLDASGLRIVNPGRVGFGGGAKNTAWDDFKKTDL